jgi:hypothetical protein
MTFLLNFIIVYQLIKKLIGGEGGGADRQEVDVISLLFSFL